MEILSDMEMLQIDENGSRLTPTSAVNAVNDAANTIEGLHCLSSVVDGVDCAVRRQSATVFVGM